MKRNDVTFLSQGLKCAAWLYEPEGNAPYPCIVMAHGFGAVREARLDAYAERFAQAGFAALVFDYRYLGASEGEPRQIIDINKQQEDWRAAIEYARSLKNIDKDRIALWGTSFSGGHVITMAAQDPKIAAVVSQIPFTDGFATIGANPFGIVLKLTWAWFKDVLSQISNSQPHYIKVVGTRSDVAAMSSPNAESGYRAILPAKTTWENRVAARIIIPTLFYRPVKSASKIKCPILVCLCKEDDVTPPQPAREVAKLANGELKEYSGDHFAPYLGASFEQIVKDEITFFNKNLMK